MIRKAVIVVLMLAAVGIVVIGRYSYSTILRKQLQLTDRNVVFIHVYGGVTRLFWFRSEGSISVTVHLESTLPDWVKVQGYSTGMVEWLICRTTSACDYRPLGIGSSRALRTPERFFPAVSWSLRAYSVGPGCPEVRFTLVRTRSWILCLLFATYPTITFIRGLLRRRRRRRKGRCLNCNYDLTGTESGICPECGEGVEERPAT